MYFAFKFSRTKNIFTFLILLKAHLIYQIRNTMFYHNSKHRDELDLQRRGVFLTSLEDFGNFVKCDWKCEIETET